MNPKRASLITISLAVFFAVVAIQAADPGKLTGAEKARLEKATEVLKSLSTYRKSRFTRLLNSGKKQVLLTLPGVGDATADAIIEARPFETSAYLILVEGIGEKTFAEIVEAMR